MIKAKKSIVILLFLLGVLGINGCQMGQKPMEKILIPVKVVSAQEEKRDVFIDYTGVVSVKDSKTYAFKSPGKIAQIIVKKGQVVKPGDILAKLDTKDLTFAADAAKAQLDAAKAQYDKAVQGPTKEDIAQLKLNVEKAQEAYTYSQDLYEKTMALQEAGAVSQDDLNRLRLQNETNRAQLAQAKLALDQAKTRPEDLAAARAKMSMAQSDYGYKESQIQDSVLLSDMDGYVAQLIQKEGDYISAGYPVIALRGQAQIIKTGIAKQDMDKVTVGSRVIVESDNKTYEGKVTFISDIPDEVTRTYEGEITLNQGALSLGSVVSIHIVVGQEEGIWIPVGAMMSNGNAGVFVVENQKAISRQVEIKSTQGMEVRVTGIHKGDRVIVEGMRSVQDGDEVNIQK